MSGFLSWKEISVEQFVGWEIYVDERNSIYRPNPQGLQDYVGRDDHHYKARIESITLDGLTLSIGCSCFSHSTDKSPGWRLMNEPHNFIIDISSFDTVMFDEEDNEYLLHEAFGDTYTLRPPPDFLPSTAGLTAGLVM